MSVESRYRIGMAQYMLQNYDAATAAFAGSLAIVPQDDDMYIADVYWLVLSQLRAGQADEAQKTFQQPFDLIICDEAHRTTGVTLKDAEDSAFVKVHDNAFIQAKKRLYMTATPRLYAEESKKKAQDADAYLCSMDDEAMYGPEVIRIGFGEAVEKNLLADY